MTDKDELIETKWMEEFKEEETRFYTAWAKELELRKDEQEGTILCPICEAPVYFIRRGERMTFAGLEPPCVQFHCDDCGFGAC